MLFNLSANYITYSNCNKNLETAMRLQLNKTKEDAPDLKTICSQEQQSFSNAAQKSLDIVLALLVPITHRDSN